MRKVILGLVVAAAVSGVASADPFDVYGTWLTEAGTAQVAISDCGDGTPCGDVVWMDPESLRPGLTPETTMDENNPDPALRSRQVLGLTMLSEFEKRRRDWRGGRIYDPETGRTYGSRLKRLASGDLQVKGCVGPICQTQVWTSVEIISETAD